MLRADALNESSNSKQQMTIMAISPTIKENYKGAIKFDVCSIECSSCKKPIPINTVFSIRYPSENTVCLFVCNASRRECTSFAIITLPKAIGHKPISIRREIHSYPDVHWVSPVLICVCVSKTQYFYEKLFLKV